MTAQPPPRIPDQIAVTCIQQLDKVTDVWHCSTVIDGKPVKVHVYLQYPETKQGLPSSGHQRMIKP